MAITSFEFAAIATALIWAIGSLVSPKPVAHLGTIAFNRWRLSMMFVLLAGFITATGRWAGLPSDLWDEVLISGIIGIFIGDTMLFATMNRLGPRRTMILFSLNAPLSAILGFFFLSEHLTLLQSLGIILAFLGVALAIAFGKRKDQIHVWEQIKGPLWIGLFFGFMAALGQSVGSLIARPVMAADADPVLVSCLRIGVAALALHIVFLLPRESLRATNAMTRPIFFWTALSGFLGMGLGMTVFLYALSGGKLGIISTLSASSPVLVLPLIWLKTRERPAAFAWVGAFIVITGNALLFL